MRAWCFRCNDGTTYRPTPSLKEAVEALAVREKERAATGTLALPEGTQDMREWPRQAVVWLAKAGINQDTALYYGIRYSPELRRVVMPVHQDGELVYWQARDVFGGRIKYLSPQVPRGGVVFKAGSAKEIVLTEDMLSAIRVGHLGEAWSTLGTSVLPSVLAQLHDTGKPVVCMFDPDPAGAKANRLWSSALRTMGVSTRIVVPRRDPKLLPNREIKELLFVD